jgi:methylmalonyl-CoA mutase N-terminal domain/subunit
VIAFESGAVDTADPLGGSYFLEQLTGELETRALAYIEKIDSMGGAVKAIEKQYYQTEIAESAYKYQQAIESKEKLVVGVNEFTSEERSVPPLLRIDEQVRERQIGRLKALRTRRDVAAVTRTLEDLRTAAAGSGNVVPAILLCVEAYCSLGEISDALREVWGQY